jgi:hypothetical protein
MVSAEQHAKIRQLISEGADAAQITERLNVDAATVIGIAQNQPQAPTTSAAGQPIYRHRKYQ